MCVCVRVCVAYFGFSLVLMERVKEVREELKTGVGLLASWHESLPPRIFKNSNGSGLKFKHCRLENIIHWGMQVWGAFLICGLQRGRFGSVNVCLRAGLLCIKWHNPTPVWSLSVWEWKKHLFCVLCNTCYCILLIFLKKLTIRLIFVSYFSFLLSSSFCGSFTHLPSPLYSEFKPEQSCSWIPRLPRRG